MYIYCDDESCKFNKDFRCTREFITTARCDDYEEIGNKADSREK